MPSTDPQPPDMAAFRSKARDWIEANLERRDLSSSPLRAGEYRSLEDIAENRVLQRKLFEAGFAGISFPSEYGGQGLDPEYERAFEEEARGHVTPDLGGAGYVTFGPIARSIVAHASPEFCRRHMPKILSGEEIWCQFYSEPEAGSDLAGIRTSATRDGDHWIIRGSKIWSTGAYYADFAMCLARTDWDVPKHQGLTWFSVPTGAPGLTIRNVVQINGTAGFCEEFLDDVVVTEDDIIGELNRGWAVAQTMLVYERSVGGAVGRSAEPRSLAPDLVALAEKVNRLQEPVARQLIAEVHANSWAQYHLGRRIDALIRRSGRPHPAVAAYGKLASGVLSPIQMGAAMELGSAEALTWSLGEEDGDHYAVEYLNGRMTSIAAGTNEMQRNGIGELVLGLPREPSFDSKRPFSEVVRAARNWNGQVG